MLLFAAVSAAPGEPAFALKHGQRVLFLGDSITFAGMYVQYLDAYLFTRFPERRYELIGLGLPSETVSGLSEPDHPYPRPNLHERLERALEKTRPDVVVACYGMNDGIYHPFSEERFAAYQTGITKLRERVRAAGATLVLMTPPPFDPNPVADKVLPDGAQRYSWMRPYAGYDKTLSRYADWLRELQEKGARVVDARAAVQFTLTELRGEDPRYTLAGDGIHLNGTGHWLMAQSLLLAWRAPAEVDRAEVDARVRRVRRGEVSSLTFREGTVSFRWRSRVPMPYDPQWDPRLAEQQVIGERLNRHRLMVTGLPAERYALSEGSTRLGEATREDLAGGLDLLRFPLLSTNRRAAELLPLVQERQQVLGRAWLSDVGHKRPDTPEGLPLEAATRKAAELEAQIRRLAEPVKLDLRLEPVARTKPG